jgi:hypothetical protein
VHRRLVADAAMDSDEEELGVDMEPDIVTALSVEEVKKYVRQARHFIKIADPRVAKEIQSKISSQGLLRRLSTCAVLAAVGAFLAGKFLPDKTPPVLRERKGKIGLTGAAGAAVVAQLIINSSPFFCYKVVFDREGVMQLSRKENK